MTNSNPRQVMIPEGEKQIGFFADVHGNLPCLLELFDRELDISTWFCAGDAVDMNRTDLGAHGNESILQRMMERGIAGVVGNHEAGLLHKEGSDLSPLHRAFIKYLPRCLAMNFGGKRILVCHATPSGYGVYAPLSTSSSALEKHFSTEEYDVIICGHTHDADVVSVKNTLVVNTGALGIGEQMSYVVMNSSGEIEIRAIGSIK